MWCESVNPNVVYAPKITGCLRLDQLAVCLIACVPGVKRGRGMGNLGTRGRKERNPCKDAIVFSIFHAQILSVKIVMGQN